MPVTRVRDPLPIEVLEEDPPPVRTGLRRSERALVVMVVLLVAGMAPLAVRAASGDGGPTSAESPPVEPAIVATTAAPPATAAAETGLDLRLTSEDGRFQAWAEPLAAGATIYAPGGRTASTIDVHDQLAGTVTTVSIDRNIEPEAFSPDGEFLYVIDHYPAANPDAYRVGRIDLDTGAFELVGPPKVPGPEEVMRGIGRQQVWAPDGTQLYTLYVRQFHDHGDPAMQQGAPEAAFVHVLDVATGWAMCLDLPHGFGLGPAGTTAIMVSADGATITVVDHHLGQRIDIERRPGEPWAPDFVIGTPHPV